MSHRSPAEFQDDMRPVPATTHFPVEVRPPLGFVADQPETWPDAPGRFEYVNGRLLYMPPCGVAQSGTVTDVVAVLSVWLDSHPDFFLGTNEAGMMLGRDVRGADAAIWRRSDVDATSSGYHRAPPVLAVEVAGQDEDDAEEALLHKARWYFSHGVPLVWIVLPESREVLVWRPQWQVPRRHQAGTLPAEPELPDLAPDLARFFRQMDR